MFQAQVNGILAAQKENAMLWIPILLGAGVGLYFSIDVELPWVFGIGGVAVAFLLAGIILVRLRRVEWYILIPLAVGILMTGWCIATIRTAMVAAPVLQKSIKVTHVEGTIATLDDLENEKGSRVILNDVVVEDLPLEKTPHSIRLSIRKDDGLRAGQRIKVLAGLNPPSPPVAPEDYDFQRYAYFMRIGAFGFAYNAPEILRMTSAGALERFRQWGVIKVKETVPEPEASIVSALLLGERAAIPEKTWGDIRAAGLAHVISISGLHISMIAMGIFFVVRAAMALFPRFALYHPIKKYAALIGMAGCIAYAVMVGLSVPTLRSVIMTGLIMGAIMLDRSPFSLRLVAVSALVILLISPEAMTGPSFEMSFGAVAALVFFFDKTRNFWTGLNTKKGVGWRILTPLLATAATSIVATIATAPFSIYHFQQFPIYSVIGNMAVLPVIGFVVMPAAVVSYLLMPFGLEHYSLWVMGKGITAMLWISHQIARWQFSSLNIVGWPLSALICFVVAGLWAMVVNGWARMIFILPLVAGIAFAVINRPPDILVSSTAKLAMIVTQDEGERVGWLSTRRTDKFSAENWIKSSGIDPKNVKTWPKEGVLGEGETHLSCDPYGCAGSVRNIPIAFSFSPRTINDDCKTADLIISLQPVAKGACLDKQVIDMWDLKDNGTHAIWVRNGGFVIETVEAGRGDRPWVLKRP